VGGIGFRLKLPIVGRSSDRGFHQLSNRIERVDSTCAFRGRLLRRRAAHFQRLTCDGVGTTPNPDLPRSRPSLRLEVRPPQLPCAPGHPSPPAGARQLARQPRELLRRRRDVFVDPLDALDILPCGHHFPIAASYRRACFAISSSAASRSLAALTALSSVLSLRSAS
jgi:hypothetical protein